MAGIMKGLPEACVVPRLEEGMSSEALYLQWSVLTVGIGKKCQKRPISEKSVDEGQGIFK